MGALSLILGQKQFRTQIGVLTLDVAENINHDLVATPTKNPIENGSNVTDNIRVENDSLSIQGIMSEAPLSLLGSAFNVFTGALATQLGTQFGGFAGQAAAAGLGSLGGLIANRNPNDAQFPQKAYNYLKELLRARTPFVIVTSLERYENMVLTKLSVPQTKDNGRSLFFSASFEKVQLVQTQTVLIPEARNPSGASKQKLGKQPAKEASAENTKNSTILFDAWKSVGG